MAEGPPGSSWDCPWHREATRDKTEAKLVSQQRSRRCHCCRQELCCNFVYNPAGCRTQQETQRARAAADPGGRRPGAAAKETQTQGTELLSPSSDNGFVETAHAPLPPPTHTQNMGEAAVQETGKPDLRLSAEPPRTGPTPPGSWATCHAPSR